MVLLSELFKIAKTHADPSVRRATYKTAKRFSKRGLLPRDDIDRQEAADLFNNYKLERYTPEELDAEADKILARNPEPDAIPEFSDEQLTNLESIYDDMTPLQQLEYSKQNGDLLDAIMSKKYRDRLNKYSYDYFKDENTFKPYFEKTNLEDFGYVRDTYENRLNGLITDDQLSKNELARELYRNKIEGIKRRNAERFNEFKSARNDNYKEFTDPNHYVEPWSKEQDRERLKYLDEEIFKDDNKHTKKRDINYDLGEVKIDPYTGRLEEPTYDTKKDPLMDIIMKINSTK